MISTIIIGSIFFGLILLGFGLYLYKSYLYSKVPMHGVFALVTYLFGVVVIIGGAVVIPHKLANKNVIVKYASIEDKIDDGYDVYVNGIKVEPEHITIDDYSLDVITIHDDTTEIHIAANK